MPPLQTTINRIEKFVYEKGTNVALYNAEHSKTYTKFEKDLQKALFSQIEYVADEDRVDSLLLVAKSVVDPLVVGLGTFLASVPLKNMIDMAAFLIWAGEQGGQAGLDKIGIDGVFGLKNRELIDYFNDYSKLIINSVDDYTKKWIAGKIQAGKNKGLTPAEIVDTLISDGKGISKIRAERIVLTETAKAMTTVELEVANMYGIEEKIWRTSRDELVCPICLPLDGEQVGLGQLFSDGSDGPPAHVSCRCFIEEVVPADWIIPAQPWLGE